MAPADAPLPLGFDVVRHGYDRAQVQKHVSNLESNMRMLTADRDSARSQVGALTQQVEALRYELAAQRAEATGTTQPLKATDDVHNQLRVMLQVTRAEAAEITARAQT